MSPEKEYHGVQGGRYAAPTRPYMIGWENNKQTKVKIKLSL